MKNIIVITGASSGMGLEFAKQLDKGLVSIDEFWLIARRPELLIQASKQLRHKTKCFSFDITNPVKMVEFSKVLSLSDLKIRMLISCAGFGKIGTCQEIPIKDQEDMIDCNCKALMRMTEICIPYMPKGSHIIQLASGSAFLPQPGFTVYAASKAFVLSYSRALGEELRSKCIFVTTVCPGPVDTPFLEMAQTYAKRPDYKKVFTVSADKVVTKALCDSAKRKPISVYGFSMKALMMLSKLVPHQIILDVLR